MVDGRPPGFTVGLSPLLFGRQIDLLPLVLLRLLVLLKQHLLLKRPLGFHRLQDAGIPSARRLHGDVQAGRIAGFQQGLSDRAPVGNGGRQLRARRADLRAGHLSAGGPQGFQHRAGARLILAGAHVLGEAPAAQA